MMPVVGMVPADVHRSVHGVGNSADCPSVGGDAFSDARVAALYRRALRIADEYGVDTLVEEDGIVPFADPRVSAIEHVCHELAHAALLGLLFGPNLSGRVAQSLKKLVHDSDGADVDEDNEVETFAVVMSVLERLGLAYDPLSMIDAIVIQLTETWEGPEKMLARWAAFRETEKCRAATDRIMDHFAGAAP